jgi:hypothetical protein
MARVVFAVKLKVRSSEGNISLGTLKKTLCSLSLFGANPMFVPWTIVSRSQVMPCSSPFNGTLLLDVLISPRSMSTPLTETTNLSLGFCCRFHLSIWYKENSMVTLEARLGSGPELGGMVMEVSI